MLCALQEGHVVVITSVELLGTPAPVLGSGAPSRMAEQATLSSSSAAPQSHEKPAIRFLSSTGSSLKTDHWSVRNLRASSSIDTFSLDTRPSSPNTGSLTRSTSVDHSLTGAVLGRAKLGTIRLNSRISGSVRKAHAVPSHRLFR